MSWSREPEGGGLLAARIAVALARYGGWRLGRALLPAISTWFLLRAAGPRRASRHYLTRILGRPARLADIWRHFHSFAGMMLDRVFLLIDRQEGFQFEVQGLDCVAQHAATGKGALLFGAHLGNFDAVRAAIAKACPVPVRVLMHRRDRATISRVFERLNPHLTDCVIEIGQPDTGLRVHEALCRGELVGLLADRADEHQTMIPVPFLGAEAALPPGPFVLAAVTGAPVLLFFTLRVAPRRYIVRFEPFAERIALPRTGREAALASWVGRYAARLETMVRAAPLNWFNFHEFWRDDAPSLSDRACLPGGRPAGGAGARGDLSGPVIGEPGSARPADGGAGRGPVRPGAIP